MLWLLNNLTFDRSLEKAVLYAVGNTLVCDSLDEAKILSWSGERNKGMLLLISSTCFLILHCFVCYSYFTPALFLCK